MTESIASQEVERTPSTKRADTSTCVGHLHLKLNNAGGGAGWGRRGASRQLCPSRASDGEDSEGDDPERDGEWVVGFEEHRRVLVGWKGERATKGQTRLKASQRRFRTRPVSEPNSDNKRESMASPSECGAVLLRPPVWSGPSHTLQSALQSLRPCRPCLFGAPNSSKRLAAAWSARRARRFAASPEDCLSIGPLFKQT